MSFLKIIVTQFDVGLILRSTCQGVWRACEREKTPLQSQHQHWRLLKSTLWASKPTPLHPILRASCGTSSMKFPKTGVWGLVCTTEPACAHSRAALPGSGAAP